jgi:hypothetical protein
MGLLGEFMEGRQEASNNLNNWLNEALDGLLGPTGIPDRLKAANLFLNPAVNVDQAQRHTRTALDPSVKGSDRALALGQGVLEVAGLAIPAIASRLTPRLPGQNLGDEAAQAMTETDFGGDDFGGAHLSLYGMPDQSGDLGRAQERVRISTPKKWLDDEAKRERGFHPASKVKMGDFDVTPKFEDRGTLLPSQSLTIEDLQGTTLTPAYGDRTRAGGILSGYDDTDFDPILMQGGQGFMREKGTGMWASETGPMAKKAKTVEGLIEAGEDPRLVYTAMGATGGDFSKMMAEASLSQLERNPVSRASAKAFNKRMTTLLGDRWPGIENPEAVLKLPGTLRTEVWKEMSKGHWRDAGFPDIGRTRLAITEPGLIDADPFDVGMAVSRPEGLIDDFSVSHPTYSDQIGGEYLGDLDMLPGPVVWRDYFDARRAAGAAPGDDQRSFMMSSSQMTQKVDQQMVDEANAYLEAAGQYGAVSPPTQAAPPSARFCINRRAISSIIQSCSIAK